MNKGPTFNLQKAEITLSNGEQLNPKELQKKAVLIVNIATQCGYTPQLQALQKLSDQYASKGLLVIGVPSNEFGGQTPESDEKVEAFCKLNYGVTFPITKKTKVKQPDAGTFFEGILSSVKQKTAGFDTVQWNFEKFLFNSKGEFEQSFRSSADPLGAEIKTSIEKLLGSP